VYVVTGNRNQIAPQNDITMPWQKVWGAYILAFVAVTVATLLNLLLHNYFDLGNLIFLYLISVTIIAFSGRIGPSMFASILSVMAYGLVFLPSFSNFSSRDFGYLASLIVMILLTQLIVYLIVITRRQTITAQHAERQTAALNKLSRQLASARGVDKLLSIGVTFIGDSFNSDIVALLPEGNDLKVRATSSPNLTMDEKEMSVARWVYDLGQNAGVGTDTLPMASALYIPLLASQGAIGVLRIKRNTTNKLFSPEQLDLLETCANQIALAIDVDRLQEQSKISELKQEIAHTRNALLQTVSKDLRAPLEAIMLSANTQMQLSRELNPENIVRIAQNIHTEAEHLNSIINNLLQITYLESEAIELHKSYGSIKDLITNVLQSSRVKIGSTPVYIKLDKDLPDVPFDQKLLEGVIINLLDNAIKFAPPDKPIEIFAVLSNDKERVIISIEDYGPGIVEDEINLLFDKFYRGRSLTTERGLGLGLAICRIIVEAHGGKIWAENREGGGSAFRFTLSVRM
jgi:two-component system sensor histidine kinase KdpD